MAAKDTRHRPGPVTPLQPGIVITGGGHAPLIDTPYTKPSDIIAAYTPPHANPTSPRVLARTAPKAPQSISVTAEGAIINWLFGPVLAQDKIFAVGTIGSDLVLGLLWGKGTVNAVNDVYANKAALPGSKVHSYTGDQVAADSWLQLAIPGYSDILPGKCYSVVRVSQADFNSKPKFLADIEGLLMYDPRTATTIYSDNAALMFRWAALEGGLVVSEASIIATANECEGLVGGSARRAAGVVFDRPLALDDILATLATYAGAIYVRDAGVAKLVPKRPGTSVASFTDVETDGTRLKMVQDSCRVKKVSSENQPNRVVCEYQDTTSVPWRRAFAATDVPAGPVRTTRLILPGIHTFARAEREAIEQLNYYQLTDLTAEHESFDEGLELEVGDLYDLTHADGLTEKIFRATFIGRGQDTGQWQINGREYQPGQYSDEAQADPTFFDTNLPDPAVVPDAPVPVLAEENYQLQNETWATRIRATWAAVTDYAYNHEFEVRASIGAVLIWTVRTTDQEAAMGPLQEGQTYSIDVYVVGVGGIKGAKGTANLLAVGKSLAPDFPGGAQLRGNEAGGRVFLNWDKANDDIWNYEVRYGSAGQAWAAMITLTQTDSLWYTAETIAEGTWDIKVRAIDSVGVESSNELTLAGVLVTSDADSYAQTDATVGVDTTTNMTLAATDYLPDDGTSWDSLYPNVMDTYTDPLVTYGGSFTTEIVSDEHDLGVIVSANFQFASNVEELVGLVEYTMQIADVSGGPYTDYSVLSVNASGRYARLKIEGLLTDRFILRPEYFHLIALVNTLTKEGNGTSSATLATTVTLDAEYSKIVSITIQPVATGGGEDLVGVPDNIVLGPGDTEFDVYIYLGGTQVARDFYYTARVIK